MRRKKRKIRKIWLTAAVSVCAFLCLSAGRNEAQSINTAPDLILQNPELPNGCEVTSLAMLLKKAGYAADKGELFEDYLPHEEIVSEDGVIYGPDPEEVYGGNAADQDGGWYCFETPIIDAGNAYLQDMGSSLEAVSLTGITKTDFDAFLEEGNAAAVWVTISFADPSYSSYLWICPDGESFHPYSNLHCVVVAGTGETGYQILDPLKGAYEVDSETFWQVFTAMGSRAAAIVENV